MIYTDITQLVGNTPLLELKHIKIPNGNRIFAKLEFFNPAGGIKDRVGVFAISKMLERGEIDSDSVIIEATAGNTGLGVALGALSVGCKAVLVVPENFSIEKQILMRALGADVVNTPEKDGINGAIAKANELVQNTPNAKMFAQFENLDNPKAHFATGAEILRDMQGENLSIDYFACGAGSGGSFSGVLEFLHSKGLKTKGVLCDPLGSILGGNKQDVKSRIEGIGNTFVPRTMDLKSIDKVFKISDEQAYEAMRLLAKSEGVLGGISSGACLHGCLKLADEVQNCNIVTIFADGWSRYFSRKLI